MAFLVVVFMPWILKKEEFFVKEILESSQSVSYGRLGFGWGNGEVIETLGFLTISPRRLLKINFSG